MAITSLNVGDTVALGAGVLYFDPWDTQNNRTGEVDLGEPDEVNLSIEQGDTTDRRTRRTVNREIIFSTTTEGSKTVTATSLSVSADVLKFFLAAEKVTITQTASAVTNEVVWADGLEAERYFQLGQSASNPVGVVGATGVSVTSFPSDIAAWQATTAYAVGDAAGKVTDDGTVWAVVTAGTTGGTEPTWPASTLGATVVSGTVTFKLVATAQETFVLDTDYQLEAGAVEGARIKRISPDTFPYAL